MSGLEQLAREMYEAMPSRASHPAWEQLGDVTKSVWRERAAAQPATQEDDHAPAQ
jgi:hypothetical protein